MNSPFRTLFSLVLAVSALGLTGCAKKVYTGTWTGTCATLLRGTYVRGSYETATPCTVTISHESKSQAALRIEVPLVGLVCTGRGPIQLLNHVQYNDRGIDFRGIATKFTGPGESDRMNFICAVVAGRQVGDCVQPNPSYETLNFVEFGTQSAQPNTARFAFDLPTTPNPTCGPLAGLTNFSVHSENLQRAAE